MRYMGSKKKLVKDIMPIILADRKPGQYYVEPFVGGCNSIDQVEPKELSIGADSNPWLAAMWKELSNGWRPSLVTEEYYTRIRGPHYSRPENPDGLPPHEVGWAMIHSFGGRFADCFGRNGKSLRKDGRTHSDEILNSLINQIPKIKGIDFRYSEYQNLEIPPNSIIYCDPPYVDSSHPYFKDEVFNHYDFWYWAKQMTHKGHTVFVSESTDPPDLTGWEIVWSKDKKSSLATYNYETKSFKVITEKLYKFTGIPDVNDIPNV